MIDGNGRGVSPGHGVVPILKKTNQGIYKITGTGFFVTRYGLFITAAHVISDLMNENGELQGFLLQEQGEILIPRRIIFASLHRARDIAIAQADNFLIQKPEQPLMNMRGKLSFSLPNTGSPLVTIGYPEHELLNFNDPEKIREISPYYSYGGLLEHADDGPYMRYPHYRTSLNVMGGMSGGPVFNHEGRIIGVNCRGFDFNGAEYEGSYLSAIVRLNELFDVEVSLEQVPPQSWEAAQLPDGHLGGSVKVSELVKFGHIDM